MAQTTPSQSEIEKAPRITFGEQSFSIPTLAPRQNRIIAPIAMKFGTFDIRGEGLTEALFDTVITVIHTAITRAKPDFTRDELLDIAMTLPEMMAAVQTIYEQTGVLAPVAGPPAGEAQAGSTGTG